ncbi:MAG: recombination regulator RecX [Chlorobiaceae bacterium]|nr:recombination regulator RecX [Chlorobiaceae bacterium]
MDEKRSKAALELAVRLLSGRAHSRYELEIKLKKKGFDEDAIVKTMERLDQLKLLDDRAFASSCMSSIARRCPEGKLKTRFRMKQKGLSTEVIDEVLASTDQLALCQAAAEKKLRTLSGPPETIKKKLITFLINRGFDWETIRKVLSNEQ